MIKPSFGEDIMQVLFIAIDCLFVANKITNLMTIQSAFSTQEFDYSVSGTHHSLHPKNDQQVLEAETTETFRIKSLH